MRLSGRFNHLTISVLAVMMAMIASTCTVSRPAANDPKDVSYIYNPADNPFNPRFRVYNDEGNRSVLSVLLQTRELFFSEANPTGDPLASMRFTVRLYNDTQGGVLSDTVLIDLELNRDLVGPEIVTDIPLTTFDGFEYTAEIRITDNLTRRMIQTFVRFNRLSPYTAYNFRVYNAAFGNELFTQVVFENEYLNLKYLREPIDTIFVLYYKYFDFIPHPPPMMLPERTVPREPDTMIPVTLSDTIPIMFPLKGIYLLTVDSTVYDGITFLNFGDEYPVLTKPETMIEPLAYIATQEEMDTLRSAEKKKMALDEFWLSRSSSIERSRELLRIYYNRVLYANFYFTSYKEGWRTDRGMFYIMYGPPDKVYKGPAAEQWGYKKPVIKSAWGTRVRVQEDYVWFGFRHNPGRFTTNDYYFVKSDAPTFWDQAVSSWRRGIVYRLDNPDDI
ncbi:MAG: GWxTD domain-containing protein [Bacteroidales bacterium]